MAEKFRYWYYMIGRKVVFCGVGSQPRDHYKVLTKPKTPPVFKIATGDSYTPEEPSIRYRRFKVKCVYAPDWDSAVAFVKSQWQKATIK